MAQDDARPVFTQECFSSSPTADESKAALNRAAIFNSFINHFGLENESNTGCRATRFDYQGAGDVESFWEGG
jgi:hypothetical protein